MEKLKEQYQKEAIPALMKKFNYQSIMQVPKLEKIVINVGLGDIRENPKSLENTMNDLSIITGQKPVVTKARKSIAAFKIREGANVGCKVTLRNEKMYEFAYKLFTVALPRVMGNDMMFYKIDSVKEHLEKSKFGIEEPKANSENYIDVKSIDLVIVPGVCFDTEKNRVGFGKGFYDRFLRNHNISTIAICFDEQILKHEKIPTSPFDVQVEKIITEQRTY